MQERILSLGMCISVHIWKSTSKIHWETFSDKFLFGELWGSMCSVSYWFAFIFNKAKDKSIFYPWSATTIYRHQGNQACFRLDGGVLQSFQIFGFYEVIG